MKLTEEQIRNAAAFIMAEPEGEGPANKNAAPGNIWVCGACGKTSPNKYFSARASPGWDESCMMNSFEVPETSLVRDASGRVTEVKDDSEKST